MRDIDVRNTLKETTLSHYYANENARVVEEMGIFQGDSRIDIAVINGSLWGYEIKSETDTLYRLDSQLRQYKEVFDFLTFVVGEKHQSELMERVPAWCGIIVAKSMAAGQVSLKHVRKPIKNTNVSNRALAELLWKDELIQLLYKKGIKKGISSKSKNELMDITANAYTVTTLSRNVRQILKQREAWRVG